MSHQDFNPLVERHAKDFEAASHAMTLAALSALRGEVTTTSAIAAIDRLMKELQARSDILVRALLPAVVLDATRTVTLRHGAPGFDANAVDQKTQSTLLELSSLELNESLQNAAWQMARDARRHIFEGLRIRAEQEATVDANVPLAT